MQSQIQGESRRNHKQPALLIVLFLVGGLVLSAPAAGGSTTSSATTVIKVDFNPTLKKTIVVDGTGRTVYMFMWDTRGKATCTPQLKSHPLCHKVLPPVTGKPRVGAGVNASKLGTTRRSDGKTQITYNRHPLYYFRGGFGYGPGDKKPGDANGQGFFQLFYVLSAKGRPIRG
jgi:predicted lipoprotein with Yx(FWY)xxD motif